MASAPGERARDDPEHELARVGVPCRSVFLVPLVRHQAATDVAVVCSTLRHLKTAAARMDTYDLSMVPLTRALKKTEEEIKMVEGQP